MTVKQTQCERHEMRLWDFRASTNRLIDSHYKQLLILGSNAYWK